MKEQSAQPTVALRSIVVALAPEGRSDHAVERALELSRLFDAPLEVVHAVGLPGLRWELVSSPLAVAAQEDPVSRVRQQVVAHVGELLARSDEQPERADELVNVVAGQPASVLLERARTRQADLIVMGALRKRRTFDFGSTARAVLAKAPCAIWVQPGAPVAIRRILVAYDFSAESKQALETATDLALRFGARLSVLHVFDLRPYIMDDGFWIANFESVEEARTTTSMEFETVMEGTDWKGLEHDWLFVEGTPDVQIEEQSKSADLLVMGTHGRTGFSSAVLGSVAYTLLKNSTGPVMVVRKQARKFAHE